MRASLSLLAASFLLGCSSGGAISPVLDAGVERFDADTGTDVGPGTDVSPDRPFSACNCPTGGGVVRVPADINSMVATVSADTCSVTYQSGISQIYAQASTPTQCDVTLTLMDGSVLVGRIDFGILTDAPCCDGLVIETGFVPFSYPDAGMDSG